MSRPRLGLVANFFLTPTFLAVANALDEYEIHWLVFSRRWHRYLIDNGVPASRLVPLWRGQGEVSLPALPTNPLGAPTLAQVAASDRVLGRRATNCAVASLEHTSALAADAIRERGLGTVFGEATWSSEIAIAYTARAHGVRYLVPAMVRYPTARFGFFEAPMQRELVQLAAANEPIDDIAAGFLACFRAPQGVGALWPGNRIDMSKHLRSPGLLARKTWDGLVDGVGNPTQHTLTGYLSAKNPVTLAWRSRAGRAFLDDAARVRPDSAEPYVLMPLQVQPEASIDVLAWHSRDQIRNVRAVTRAFRGRYRVAVKEHSHFFGSRPASFYREIDEISGAFLVHPDAESRQWADGASAVVTPSGTMAYENALRGGCSVVMAQMYFCELPNVHCVPASEAEKLPAIVADHRRPSTEQILEFLRSIVRHSSPGTWGNVRSSPDLVSPTNVAQLAGGFRRTLEGITS